MAVVNTKSTLISNREATPSVPNNSAVEGGMIRGVAATLESVSGDDIASVYRFFRVPSNARVHDLKLYCDDIGSTTIADIGLYQTAANGGAVVDADFFGSAVSLKDGALNGTDVAHESGVFNIDDVMKPLWSALGLSADPKIDYEVCLTLTAASDAAGTISLKMLYAI